MKDIKICDLSTDLNAPILATKLISQSNLEIDSIYILPVGAKRRPYDKEVKSVSKYYLASKQKEGRIIEVNKEGLYDMLPEGVFHQPPASNPNLTQKDILQSIRRQREEENNARKFFLPFEAELNFLNINLSLHETRLNDKKNRNGLIQIFESRWPELSLLSARQAFIWLHILPQISQKKNDDLFLQQLLQHLFGIPIGIKRKKIIFSPKTDPNSQLQAELGNIRLGIDAVIGKPSIQEDGLVITLFSRSDKQLLSFRPNCRNHRVMEMVLTYLLPSFTPYELIVSSNKEPTSAVAESVESLPFYLGYTADI